MVMLAEVVQHSRDTGEGVEDSLLRARGDLFQHVHEVMMERAEGDP